MVEPLAPSDPRRIGPYQLEGRLGAGGMGQVFLGTSAGGRGVAVKVIRPELAATAQFRARFAREVEAARRVSGFHTAQIVDADPEAASPWLAAEYIPGPTLQQVVTAQGPLPPEAVLRLGAGIAEGLAAVHNCHLVHRDLKPGNVILAADGPRIIDFGIAHAADAGPMTHPGTVIGTYAYMSPEQIRTPAQVTPASDVFSLGSVLAFAATGRGPFDASTVLAIIHRVTSEAPVLTGIAVGSPLHVLVGHCLTKDPAGRPPTSEILRRLAVTAPATPPAPAMPPLPAATPAVGRPIRRRALLFGGVAATTAAVAVPAAFVLWPKDAPSPAEPQSKPSASKSPDRDITRTVGELTGHEGRIESLAISRDGEFLATGSYDKTLRLWDLAARREKTTFEGHTNAVWATAFSADGATLYSGALMELMAWDANSGAPKKKLAAYGSENDFVTCLAVSPDGTTLAGVTGEHGRSGIRLWNTANGRLLRTLGDTGSANYYEVAFSPDGRTLIVNGPGVQLWDVASGSLTRKLTDRHKHIDTAAYRPADAGTSGKAIVVGGGRFVEVEKTDTVGRTVSVWDADSGKLATTLVVGDPKTPMRAYIGRLAFTPDGRTLAGVCTPAGGEDGVEPSVQLWQLP
ncbi:WD40 repeat domain-containing serine/threonine protein kinase [Streptomyces sp. NPDC059452]|uniref:WD40 repeat domain-containing serine/threonine protein kinase n=1 Tax=Streptomyces sp. NPDC059452 TaxID=3346835 RepID=UPI0036B09525